MALRRTADTLLIWPTLDLAFSVLLPLSARRRGPPAGSLRLLPRADRQLDPPRGLGPALTFRLGADGRWIVRVVTAGPGLAGPGRVGPGRASGCVTCVLFDPADVSRVATLTLVKLILPTLNQAQDHHLQTSLRPVQFYVQYRQIFTYIDI